MFVMTREVTEEDNVKDLFITNPRFDIDEVRKIKAMIRFHTKDIKVEFMDADVKLCDIHTLMKFSRCIGISTVNGALYQIRLRLPGKEQDTMYHITTLYKDDGIYLTVTNAHHIDKNSVNI